MRRSEVISRIFGLLVLALLLTWLAEDAHGQATDTYIGACASQQSCTLATNVSWATGNQVWRFTAYQPNESIRVWIWNHNPTNGHSSQTVQIWVTDDGAVPSLLNNADRWVQACVTDNSTTGAQLKNVSANNPTATPGANGKATGYTVGMYAVQIAVRITGAAAQAGNPDTFDIGIVQQPTTYPGGPQPGCDSTSGGQTTNGAPIGLFGAATDGILTNSIQFAGVNGTTTATAPGAVISYQTATGTTFDRYFYCGTLVTFSVASTTTQIVALSGTTKIRICSGTLNPTTATAGTVDLVSGTGVNCGGGTATVTGAYTLPASAVVSIPLPTTSTGPIILPAGTALCVRTVTTTVAGFVMIAQF